MRSARYKTRPHANRKVPFGIARQRELIDLVERRFAQAELIRDAVRCARDSHAVPSLAGDDTAWTAASTDDAPSAAEATSASTADAPSAEEAASASTDDAPSAETTAASTDDAPSAGEAAFAPAKETADALAASARDCDEPLYTVTVLWHGKEETVKHPEVWLTIFDDVKEAGDAITRELVRRRFCDEPYWKTCDALYLSHSAYYHNVREILHYTLACAVSYGILDPRPKHPAESA